MYARVARGIGGLLLSLAMVCGAWAGAQTGAGATAETNEPVAGSVVDEQGQPVADAEVQAYQLEGARANWLASEYVRVAETRSDKDGRFSLSVPVTDREDESRTLFVARKPGLALTWRFDMQARWDEGLANLKLKMLKAGSASGTVVGADGKPVAGAAVVPSIAFRDANGNMQMLPMSAKLYSVQTDAQGVFVLEGLPVGATFSVRVSHANYATMLTSGQPGNIQAGQGFTEGQKDIRIELKPAARIEGAVRLPDGKPAQGAEVIIAPAKKKEEAPAPGPENSLGATSVKTDAQGQYAIADRPEGTYDMYVLCPDWAPTALREVKAVAGQVTAGQDFALAKGVRVSGKFVWKEKGTPVAGGIVNVSAPEAIRRTWPVKAGEDGVFSFQLPPSGDQEIRIAARTSAGRIEAGQASQKFKLQEGQDRTDIVFTVLPWFVVRGKVTDPDGNPVAGALVSQRRESGRKVKTGPDGTYELPLRTVSPSQYELVAVDAREADPGTRRGVAFTSFAKEGDVTLDIRLLPTAAATGRVVDGEGRPLPGASVRMMRHMRVDNFGQLAPDGEVLTDAEGRFLAEGLAAEQEYWLTATKAGLGQDQVQNTRLESGKKVEIRDLELLPADKAVSGIVLDEDGKPAAGASVYVSSEHSVGQHVMTGEDGRFKVEGLVNENVQVHASQSANGPQYYGRATAAAGDEGVEITLMERGGNREQDAEAKRLVDKEAPAWDLAEWVRGNAIDLAALRGGRALVAFVDLTHENAGEVVALLNATAGAHKELKIVAIQVAGPAKADVEKAAKGLDASIALALDKSGEGKAKSGVTSAKYRIKKLPGLYILDREGKIQFQDVAIAAIEKALNGAPAAAAPGAAAKPAISVESPVMEGRPATGAK